MADFPKSNYTQQELDRLQRLRASVQGFQNGIGALPADDQSNPHNEQFNHLRRQVKVVVNDPGFDEKVNKAITEEMLVNRTLRVIMPRISAIVIFGVILALLGLGVNSIILEDVLINSLGCLVSTTGMFLIIGAFVVLAMNLRRRRLTNFGDLYQRCNTLLYEIDHALTMAIPSWVNRPQVDIPNIPAVIELALDSLDKQATDWQEKLKQLEEQRLNVGAEAPMELIINIDFVQRELGRVNREIERLNGRMLATPEMEGKLYHSPPKRTSPPEAREVASASTLGMPTIRREEAPKASPEDGIFDTDETTEEEPQPSPEDTSSLS